MSLVEAKGARTTAERLQAEYPAGGHRPEARRARRPRRRTDRGEIPRGPQGSGEAHQRKPPMPTARIMEAKGLLPKGASANYTMVRFDMTHTPTGRFRGGHQDLRGLDEGQPYPQERPRLWGCGLSVSRASDAGIAVRNLSKGLRRRPGSGRPFLTISALRGNPFRHRPFGMRAKAPCSTSSRGWTSRTGAR